MTTTTTTQPVTTCPSWCDHHYSIGEGEPLVHNSNRVEVSGCAVSLTTVGEDRAATIFVDELPINAAGQPASDLLALAEGDAHELGMALVRAADRIRRDRMEAQA